MPDSSDLSTIAAKLTSGTEIPPVTVRDFLWWFGAQRRSFWNVRRIRHALATHKLVTVPDFESAYIDSNIRLKLVTKDADKPSEEADQTSNDADETSSMYSEPAYKLMRLEAANKAVISVRPDSTLQEIITILMANDFSQLPVVTGETNVRGIVSWESIGTRLGLGRSGARAQDFMDEHREIKSSASLFSAIPTIVVHNYVLVRGQDNRISGIVTAADLSVQFKQLSEPFLLIGEIENHIRRILEGKFKKAELETFKNPEDNSRTISSVADLNFGEYIRILEHPEYWEKLKIGLDRKIFCNYLDKVRATRNEIMHFDPDGIGEAELVTLRDLANLLGKLKDTGAT